MSEIVFFKPRSKPSGSTVETPSLASQLRTYNKLVTDVCCQLGIDPPPLCRVLMRLCVDGFFMECDKIEKIKREHIALSYEEIHQASYSLRSIQVDCFVIRRILIEAGAKSEEFLSHFDTLYQHISEIIVWLEKAYIKWDTDSASVATGISEQSAPFYKDEGIKEIEVTEGIGAKIIPFKPRSKPSDSTDDWHPCVSLLVNYCVHPGMIELLRQASFKLKTYDEALAKEDFYSDEWINRGIALLRDVQTDLIEFCLIEVDAGGRSLEFLVCFDSVYVGIGQTIEMAKKHLTKCI